ncbi:MAG TPA: CDP-diacylglycerol--glycerol-3-phosphate 3-phosphatidyltransferase, partial [Terriglobia bacterium]|nr:CDP-diacylglycerol--glycerol-3-phosphate 3-phosphatidyltransferase [Terriglobia bacterium]
MFRRGCKLHIDMNLPLSLTVLRIFFVPLIVVLMLTKGDNMDIWAVAVFLLASATDLADGYLARKRGQVTALGILLDPLADKLLTASAFISLVWLHLVPAWMVVIIVGRELAVTGLRSIASAQGMLLQASELGKTKMVLQVAAISLITLVPRFPSTLLVGMILLWLVVVFALISGTQYFWDFRRKMESRLKHQISG